MSKQTYVLVDHVWEPIIGGGSAGPIGPTGPGGSPKGNTVFSIAGPLDIGIGYSRWYNPTASSITLTSIRASIGVPPTGSSLISTLLLNNNVISTCTIPVGSNTSGRISMSKALLVDQYLTVNITQVGSTVPGSDLVIQIEY